MSRSIAFLAVSIAAIFAAVGIVLVGSGFLSGSSRAEWVLTEEPVGNVLNVQIAVGNSCMQLDRVNVHESPDVVNVSAYVVTKGSEACNDILQIERRRIELDEPLGDRELVGCDPPGEHYYARAPELQVCRSVGR
jgi:hypothetical protein